MRILGLVGLALTIAGWAAAAIFGTDSQSRGFDEIAYTRLREQVVQPGQTISQPVDLQSPSLTRIGFLYSNRGPWPAPLVVRVWAGNKLLAVRQLSLAPTLNLADREAWWTYQAIGDAAPNAWQTLARFQEVPLPAWSGAKIVITLATPRQGQPVVLYWSPASFSGPSSFADPQRRYAIRTEYGPVEPSLAKLPLYVHRMAAYGSPWLPEPMLWILACLFLLLVGTLIWLLVGSAWPNRQETISDRMRTPSATVVPLWRSW
jgi:hypothetical protein